MGHGGGRRAAAALVCALAWAILAGAAQAAVREQTIDYHDGEVALQGTLYADDAHNGPRPGVLVIHEWWGLNDYARQRARRLAELGYVAFAVDMYGAGKVTEHPKQAGEWAGMVTANVAAWRQRALAALAVLRAQAGVDPARLAAIGYCFGGASVLQLAYSGADLRGVVSFHGSLPAADAAEVGHIRARILVEHGGADGFVGPERVAAFEQALAGSAVDWRVTVHGGAKHGFTNPDAGDYGLEGLAYDARADRRSWAAMQDFFGEIFAP
ncbi:MAG: dienelactone hydrolase family protein [Gammaproteobacteria bacterium]|nr:dienelactone hydrolase family protein [Gammaproteobacteria bacterium]MCP5198930.1 dienelactone hydrolase family protein [Gammaproteobacteria bacterium]